LKKKRERGKHEFPYQPVLPDEKKSLVRETAQKKERKLKVTPKNPENGKRKGDGTIPFGVGVIS